MFWVTAVSLSEQKRLSRRGGGPVHKQYSSQATELANSDKQLIHSSTGRPMSGQRQEAAHSPVYA